MSKGKGIEKAHYYVQYLGWKECKGLAGREFTEPIVKDLVIRRQAEELPKLTIEVSKKELKIYQLVEHKRGRSEKIKYPTVSAKDLTYAIQGLSPDEDVAACIYLGFNPSTRSAVHVHVYRFDSSASADRFVQHITQIINLPEHQERLERVEEELVAKGQITPRPKGFMSKFNDGQSMASTALTYEQDLADEEIESFNKFNARVEKQKSPYAHEARNGHIPTMEIRQWESERRVEGDWTRNQNNGYNDDEEDIYRLEKEMKQDTLAAELKTRLAIQKTPLLLPPKDYDTVTRAQGNLLGIETRRSQNEVLTGDNRRSSGGDSARGDSDTGSYRHSDDGAYDYRPHGSTERLDHRRHPEEAFDRDPIPVSPRWKTGAQYVPPSMGRPVSPTRGRSPPRGRTRSPARALSPQRQPMNPVYDYQSRTLDPYRMDGGRDPRYPADGRGGKKYTATNLGLTDHARGMRSQDEGYTSIERPSRYANPYQMTAQEPIYNTKERTGKKDKKKDKGKKSNWPGDDIPIDYTYGPSAHPGPSYYR